MASSTFANNIPDQVKSDVWTNLGKLVWVAGRLALLIDLYLGLWN